MKFDIIKEKGNKKTVHFFETKEEVDGAFKSVRKTLLKDMKMPGFRPGKIPKSIIDRKYGNLIRAEAGDLLRDRMIGASLEEYDWILDDEKPTGEVMLPSEGEDYEFDVTFSLLEDTIPKNYKGVKLEIPIVDFDKAVENTLQNIREKLVSYEESSKSAEMGDVAILSELPSEKNDDNPENTGEKSDKKSETFNIKLGEKMLGPGMDEIITGLKKHDVFSVRIEKKEKEEKGEEEKIIHSFRIENILNPDYPEIDDEFAKKVGNVDTLEEMKNNLRKDLDIQFQKETKEHLNRLARQIIVERNEIKAPNYMVENLKQDYLENMGAEEKEDKKSLEFIENLASQQVKEFLVLRGISKAENIEITMEEIEKEKRHNESVSSTRDRIRNEKALDFVLEHAKVKEVKRDKSEDVDEQETTWNWVAVNEKTKMREEG